MLSIEEVLAGVVILLSSPLALDSSNAVALANPAAAILGREDVVSKEVFEQTLKNATIKFTYPRFVASRHPRHLEQFAKIRRLLINTSDLHTLGWEGDIHTVLSPFVNLEHFTLGYDICAEEPPSNTGIDGIVSKWRKGNWGYRNFANVKPAGITMAHHATFRANKATICEITVSDDRIQILVCREEDKVKWRTALEKRFSFDD